MALLRTFAQKDVKLAANSPWPIKRPKGKPQGIALAEGTGVKPFLASARLNQAVIGAAGGQMNSPARQANLAAVGRRFEEYLATDTVPVDWSFIQEPQIQTAQSSEADTPKR